MASNRPLGLLGPAKLLSKHANGGRAAPTRPEITEISPRDAQGKPRPSWTKSYRRDRGSPADPHHLQVTRLSPDARFSPRTGGWLCGRLEHSQRRAQRIEARSVGKSVVFDGTPDRRSYRGEFTVGEANSRHGPASIGRHLSSKEAIAPPGGP